MLRNWFVMKRLLIGLAVWAFVAFVPALTLAQQVSPQTAAQEGFVPVGEMPAQEQIPAAPLVIAAYATAWIVIFVYIWSVWRRLTRVEQELAEVSRRVAAGARR